MFELKNFRTIALAEATSFLILLVATIIKYSASAPMGVQIMGPIHGAFFIGYVVLAFGVRKQAGWGFWATVLVLLGAVLPFGGFVVDRKMVEPNLRPMAMSS